jgi:small subunit ribosomal protein S19e
MPRIIHDVRPDEFIVKVAEELKKTKGFETPEWVFLVKSSVAKKRVPQEDDFWYMRSASILRQLYIHGVVGVGRLRTRYGSKKNRGVKPSKFRKASGKIIRSILQQAETVGFVEKVVRLQHGRRLTTEGKEFLDKIAKLIAVEDSKKILEKKSSSKNDDDNSLEEKKTSEERSSSKNESKNDEKEEASSSEKEEVEVIEEKSSEEKK